MIQRLQAEHRGNAGGDITLPIYIYMCRSSWDQERKVGSCRGAFGRRRPGAVTGRWKLQRLLGCVRGEGGEGRGWMF